MAFKRIVASLLAVSALGLAGAAPAVTLRSIPTVSCVTPKQTLYEKRINASGTIESQNMKEIYLDTPVLADSVNVSVGDYVHQGQILATIDTDLTKSIMEESIPSSALTDTLENVSLSDLGNLTSLYTALQGSSLLGSDLNSLGDILSVYGSTDQSVNQKNTYIYIPEVITAPMDGIVTEVGIKSNVLSRTSKPVITIADGDSFVAMVTVSESYASDLHVGDKAVITGTGFSGKYTGRISRIYPVARKITGTSAQETVVDVEIAIDDPDEALKSGFTARAEITTGTRKTMLTIPYEAIQQDENNVEYVYLAQGSHAVRRDIETGMELQEGVEVVEGLEETDVILANASVGREGGRIYLQRGE